MAPRRYRRNPAYRRTPAPAPTGPPTVAGAIGLPPEQLRKILASGIAGNAGGVLAQCITFADAAAAELHRMTHPEPEPQQPETQQPITLKKNKDGSFG